MSQHEEKKYSWKDIYYLSVVRHAVYPFQTSDEYRVSVAGNVFLKASQNQG